MPCKCNTSYFAHIKNFYYVGKQRLLWWVVFKCEHYGTTKIKMLLFEHENQQLSKCSLIKLITYAPSHLVVQACAGAIKGGITRNLLIIKVPLFLASRFFVLVICSLMCCSQSHWSYLLWVFFIHYHLIRHLLIAFPIS